MATVIQNLDIDTGIDYYIQALYTDYLTNLPVDLTGYSALLEFRYTWDDPRILQTFSTTDGSIQLGVEGIVAVWIKPMNTDPALQTYPWTHAVYDLILTDLNGVKHKIRAGAVNLIGTISR